MMTSNTQPVVEKKSYRILLIDDEALIRDLFSEILKCYAGCTFEVAEAGDGATGVALAVACPPDIVIVDLLLNDGVGGLATMRKIKELFPDCKFLVWSCVAHRIPLAKLVENGANGAMLKEDAVHDVIPALITILAGGSYFSPKLVDMYTHPAPLDPFDERMARLEDLTISEREVFDLIGKECSNEEIIEQRCISRFTLYKQRQRIMDKLDIHNAVDLAIFAVRIHRMAIFEDEVIGQ
jgi:DNA-binding NarL/FixJ family response regulator